LSGVDVDLAAVVDPDLARASASAARFGFARALAAVDELPPGVDAVAVAVPNDLYRRLVPALLARGCHVLAEKPLGRDAAEADAFVRAASAAGLVGGVGLTWRHLPAIDAVARLVRDGAIGDVRHVSGRYHASYASSPDTPLTWRYDVARAGGGALLDVGAHLVGVLDHVCGPFSRVVAASSRTLIPRRPLPDGTGAGEVTTDDVTTALVELAGGGVGDLSISRVAIGTPNELSFRVYGTTGSVYFDASRPDGFGLYLEDAAPYQVNGVRRVVAGPHHEPFGTSVAIPAQGLGSGFDAAFVAQAQAFLLAVTGRAPLAADFRVGARVMRVCDAIRDAAASGRAVPLP
jgi:predicted dehydrogenase